MMLRDYFIEDKEGNSIPRKTYQKEILEFYKETLHMENMVKSNGIQFTFRYHGTIQITENSERTQVILMGGGGEEGLPTRQASINNKYKLVEIK